MAEEFIDMKGQPRRELERELALNYKLEEVVGDLVDNSIDAGAQNIEIIYNEEIYNNKKSFYVIVLDDGKGIADDMISSVMNFGAPRDYDELELGKFGVGMKSSSLSQAKEVTLISKVKNGNANLRRLSSEVVYEQDRWTLIPTLRPHMETDAIAIARERLAERSAGSAVILEDMHKLKHVIGNEENRISYLQLEYGHIKEYLSLVFEKYIEGTTLTKSDGTKVHRKINLFFNGYTEANKLAKLDPFCKDMQDGSVTGTLCRKFLVEMDDGLNIHKLPVTIWITPKADDRPDNYDKRIDTSKRNPGIAALQGMYIYRNNRLIDFPGWKKVLKQEPHMTCLRWEIHFPPMLDSEFQLDPGKREIILPRKFFDSLAELSRKPFKWHEDDEKAGNHRSRARDRQSGKDKPKPIVKKPSPPNAPNTVTKGKPASPIQPSSPTNPLPTSPTSVSTQPQPLKGVKIKKLAGSITGQLFVSERQEGDKLSVTLNTKHALYKSFIEEIKKQ